MKFYVKVYKVQSELMVAACDEEVYGKCYEEGELVLRGEKKFYGDDLMSKKGTLRLLRQATIANLLGNSIVGEGIKMGIIDPRNVIRVKGVPHAQMVRM
jgi:hypothetical protein